MRSSWEIEHRPKNLNEKKKKFLQVFTSHIRFIFSEYIPYYITFLSKLSFLHTTYIYISCYRIYSFLRFDFSTTNIYLLRSGYNGDVGMQWRRVAQTGKLMKRNEIVKYVSSRNTLTTRHFLVSMASCRTNTDCLPLIHTYERPTDQLLLSAIYSRTSNEFYATHSYSTSNNLARFMECENCIVCRDAFAIHRKLKMY